MTAAGHESWTRLDHLPRRHLTQLPTPLVSAPGLTSAVGGPTLWLKRDDLISFGFGGNKVRGLELLIADAQRQDADVVVTGAGVQSNHVRATAAAAACAGMELVAVFWGDPPGRVQGNYRLTRLLGGRVHFTESDDRASVDAAIDDVCRTLRAEGRRPYAIPRGGACGLGALGHTLAVRELYEQCATAQLHLDAIVLATGSAATLAGWMLGRALLGTTWRIEAITVSRPGNEVRDQVVRLAEEAGELIGAESPVGRGDVVVHDEYIGPGYGVPTPEGLEAIRIAARHEGVFFDPTYTGKAFAGLLDRARRGLFTADETVVFMHTGGEPTLFVDGLDGP